MVHQTDRAHGDGRLGAGRQADGQHRGRPHPDRSAEPAVMSAVAATVRALRHGRGLSVDQLAARAGVGKGSLVALENAAANPNLATLVRIADALAVPVSTLVEQDAARRVQISDAARTEPLWRGPGGGTARLLLTTPTAAPVELWRWQLAAGETYESHPHPAGVVETVTIIAGAAVVTVDGTDYPVSAGLTATFAADVGHSYHGSAGDGADLLMTVHLPAAGPKPRPPS